MRVIHFVENCFELTETFVYNFVMRSAIGNEVKIVCFAEKNKELFPLPKNVNIVVIRQDPGLSRNSWRVFHWIFIRKILGKRIWFSDMKSIIDDFKPDLVHCHFGPSGVLLTEFCKFYSTGVPFVTSFYGYDVSELPLRDSKYKTSLNDLWKYATYLLAEGPSLSDKLVRLGAPTEKVRLNPIIIDIRKYPERNSHVRQNGAVNFLFIGRFVEKKGFHIFLEALNKLNSKVPPVNITVIGSGPMQDAYEKIILNGGRQDNVSFVGRKSLDECIKYLREADVFVQASVVAANGDSEGGAPTTLLEAQASGVPVICSNHADIPFVMGYDDFMAREGDVDDLSGVILKFINDKSLEQKVLRGRQKVLEHHDLIHSNFYSGILKEFDSKNPNHG